MTNPACVATNSDVEKLINSEIADFFAGIGQPGEPETPQEMQQQLQSRISAILNAAPNGMMQLSNELAEMKRKCAELQEQKDKWAAWAIALGAKADELESRPLCVKSNDAMREAAPLCVKLPDSSSKAFWSGIGKTEQFHPETYKRWVKEVIERAGSIAGIKVEVK